MKRALVLMLLLAACGPIPVEQAMQQCLEPAQAAEGPTGKVTVGVSTDGPFASAELGVSSDYLAGKDPAQVYDQCVYARSGQFPTQSYNSLSAN